MGWLCSTDLNPLPAHQALNSLRTACEAAKLRFTEDAEAVTVRVAHAGLEYAVTVTRQTFENICAPLVSRMMVCVDRILLDDNARPPDKVALVALVGGASRTSVVRQALRRKFGEQKVRPVGFEHMLPQSHDCRPVALVSACLAGGLGGARTIPNHMPL